MTSQSFQKDVSRQLAALRDDPDDTAKIAFPTTLTSADRKYIHRIAESFRLPTQSLGEGATRYITVHKTAPDGHVARRQFTAAGQTASLGLSAEQSSLLADVVAQAPPSQGCKTVLAQVRPFGRKAKGSVDVGLPDAGEEAEGYWPDDDTWMPCTISEWIDDENVRITWTEDQSESDVPYDYVRRLPGGPALSLDVHEAAVEERRQNPGYQWYQSRESLPGYTHREKVVNTITRSQVTLLVGETGCGKSTQVPQVLLDGCPDAKILVMQPRKLAAITLAQRVSQERCEPVGKSVGYQVPFEDRSRNARLVFCTLGVFRKRLLMDTELTGITHVIFDEVHERDKLADFNMIFMRDLLSRRRDLRLILMSATLQMETFEKYFQNAAKLIVPGRVFPVSELYMDEIAATLWKNPMLRPWLGPGILCGGIDIPAKTGPDGEWNEREWKTVVFRNTKPEDKETLWGLKEKGLESQMLAPMGKARLLDGLKKHDVLQQSNLVFDYPIIEALLLHIDKQWKAQQAQKAAAAKEAGEELAEEKPPGTVLVFLPGWGDIDQLQRRLSANFDSKRFNVLPLHSMVTPDQQKEIFKPSEGGIRKIVLTTNIAEASITVDGTEFVIDCGRAKEVSYDPYLKVGTLTTCWISAASAKQRAGRAGRTQGGLAFHLFCRWRYEQLDEHLPPELLRSPLEDSALTAKLMLLQMGSKDKVSTFLRKAPDPPEDLAITNALTLLTELGALTPDEQLTALGEHLTRSTLPPRLAKTVLWAVLFGILDDALTCVVATGGFLRDPFQTQGKSREESKELKQQLAAPHNSDHMLLLKAVQGMGESSNQQSFCDKWCLNKKTMMNIREQQNKLFVELKENKTESFANRNRGNHDLLIAVMAAGIFPNVARRRGESQFLDCQLGKVEAGPHGSSVYEMKEPNEWVFYQELSQVESSYKLKQVSPILPVPLLLLCGDGPLKIENAKGGATVSLLDGWVAFKTDMQTGQQLQKLRGALSQAFQHFCLRPDQIPDQDTLSLLDQAVPLFAPGAPHGTKRPAGGEHAGAPPRQMMKGANGKGKLGGGAGFGHASAKRKGGPPQPMGAPPGYFGGKGKGKAAAWGW